jgi:hypothetical protein
MITTDQLAKFGATAYATLTFTTGSAADTVQGLCDAAARLQLDIDSREQAREVCDRFDLNPIDLGDTARVIFDQPITVERPTVRAAILGWHTAREGDSNDDEHDAAATLIEALLDYAGIHVASQ